jgi:hypothetical protein
MYGLIRRFGGVESVGLLATEVVPLFSYRVPGQPAVTSHSSSRCCCARTFHLAVVAISMSANDPKDPSRQPGQHNADEIFERLEAMGMRRAAYRTVDSDAVDRVLVATGKRFVPAGFDKVALRDAINRALVLQRVIEENRPGRRARMRLKNLVCIGEALDAALSLLRADNDATRLIVELEPGTRETVAWASAVVEGIKFTLDRSSKATSSRYPDRVPTAIGWLVAIELPCVYEEHIGRNAGVSRSNIGKPDGPTVRFIVAVLREIGASYAPESIVRDMTRYASVRERRSARLRERDIGQK